MAMDKKEAKEKLGRRDLFRLGAHKVAKAAFGVAEARVLQRASRFIRPPFAVAEMDFLLNCTRCDACIDACPHNTIFPLSARLGLDAAATPALDLTVGACHLCVDWPCVNACETGALKLPEPDAGDEEGENSVISPPRLAEARIDESLCLPYSGPECGACGSVCPIPGAIKWDMTRPTINMDVCTGCALCRDVCITTPKAITISSIKTTPEKQNPDPSS